MGNPHSKELSRKAFGLVHLLNTLSYMGRHGHGKLRAIALRVAKLSPWKLEIFVDDVSDALERRLEVLERTEKG